MRKTIPIIVVIAALVCAGGIYYFTGQPTEPSKQVHTPTTWKTYHHQEFGFTIKYPSQYSADQLPRPRETQWGREQFLGIFDPEDTSTYEFHVIPVRVNIKKQPLNPCYDFGQNADESYDCGKVYHSVEEYMQSAWAQAGDTRTEGELVSVNGVSAVHFHYVGAWGQEDAPYEEYVFIKNDLIYEIYLKTNDPYREEILQSFSFI